MWALSLVAACLSASVVFMPGLSPLPSMSASAMSVPVSRFALPSMSNMSVLILGSTPPSTFVSALFMPKLGLATLPSASDMSIFMPRLLTFLSVSSIFGISMPVPGLLTPLTVSFISGVSVFLPVPGF